MQKDKAKPSFSNATVIVKYKRRMQNPGKHLRWVFFVKIVNGFQLLTFFVKRSILDVSQVSEYASE